MKKVRPPLHLVLQVSGDKGALSWDTLFHGSDPALRSSPAPHFATNALKTYSEHQLKETDLAELKHPIE